MKRNLLVNRSDFHPNHTNIVDLFIIPFPGSKSFLYAFPLRFHGFSLDGQQQFFKVGRFEFLSLDSPVLVDDTVGKNIESVLIA